MSPLGNGGRMKRITISLPADELDAARRAARDAIRPLSHWVRVAIREKLGAGVESGEGGIVDSRPRRARLRGIPRKRPSR